VVAIVPTIAMPARVSLNQVNETQLPVLNSLFSRVAMGQYLAALQNANGDRQTTLSTSSSLTKSQQYFASNLILELIEQTEKTKFQTP